MIAAFAFAAGFMAGLLCMYWLFGRKMRDYL